MSVWSADKQLGPALIFVPPIKKRDVILPEEFSDIWHHSSGGPLSLKKRKNYMKEPGQLPALRAVYDGLVTSAVDIFPEMSWRTMAHGCKSLLILFFASKRDGSCFYISSELGKRK